MNLKAAIQELDKIAQERISQNSITAGSNENNMRLKVSDMRRILMAMEEKSPIKDVPVQGVNEELLETIKRLHDLLRHPKYYFEKHKKQGDLKIVLRAIDICNEAIAKANANALKGTA